MQKRPVPKVHKNSWNDESWLTENRIMSFRDDSLIYAFHGPSEPCPHCGNLSGFAYVDNDDLHCLYCAPEQKTTERLSTQQAQGVINEPDRVTNTGPRLKIPSWGSLRRQNRGHES